MSGRYNNILSCNLVFVQHLAAGVINHGFLCLSPDHRTSEKGAPKVALALPVIKSFKFP